MYLVSGATGNVGREVVRALLDRGAPVRALSRTGDASGHGLPDGVETTVGDLNDPRSLTSALQGVRGAFVLPGYADMPGLYAAAERAGVEHVVQLSGRSAASGDTTNAVTAYMVRTEEALRASGLPWTIVRPSAFASNALRWLPQLRAGDTVRLPFARVPIACIDPYDIGEVAAESLLHDAHRGHLYELSGPEALLPSDQVRILGRALGRDLHFEEQPDAEARTEMEAAMPTAYVDAFFRFYTGGELDESPILPTVHQVTGHPPRPFTEWARTHTKSFT